MLPRLQENGFWLRTVLPAVVIFASPGLLAAAETAQKSSQQASAREILEQTGVKGGLIVHLGCGDGRLTAALGGEDRYLVHGLDADATSVDEARAYVHSLGRYGRVSIDQLRGQQLPYVDNLVNLLVSEDLGAVATAEVMRVLAPGGVAYVKSGAQWTKTVKPRPAEIDEWTHYLYDASNNAVCQDSRVGPPHQLQWVGGPRWARSHDHLASLSAAVSSGGRIFYIIDEGPIAAVALEPTWYLVARDAFSGVILWKRPIPKWEWHLRGFRSGPSELAKRLVAAGDRVYVTLGIDAPLSALDGATGRTLSTYDGTDGTLELVHHEGTLFVVAGDRPAGQAAAKARRRGQRPGFAEVRPQRPAYPEMPARKRIMAIEAATGRVLWKKSDSQTAELMPTALAASGGKVFFQNADAVLCLDARSGDEVWRAGRPVSRNRPTWSAPTLVVYGDVVLSGDRAVAERAADEEGDRRKVQWMVSSAGGRAPVGELVAFSAEDGSRLWSSPCRECYNAPVDVLVADGLVWTGSLVRANEPGITEGRDPKTGEVKRTRPKDQEFFLPGMGHGRCHRNRATCRYLVLGRSGVEFIDLATGQGIANHWARGSCQYGVMPCNGLLYAPPHSCACFVTAKLDGFNCLAPKRGSMTQTPQSQDDRLQRGPAFDGRVDEPRGSRQTANPESPTSNHQSPIINLQSDWPTYRHDAARSGCTASAVPGRLGRSWQVELGGKLTSVVVAEGKLLVAEPDAHAVHALGADDGQPIWSYTAGGRVDSPPTLWQGRVLFGSADGWVYCLRASDGALAWRFRAAPADQRIVAYGQLESAWPVPGSVLVRDGTVYCVAGRSSYLEGGIRLVRLDAKTGRKLSETVIDHRDPETGHQPKGVVRGTNIPGALPDVLSSDGQSVYMRHTRFDLEGRPQPPDVPHLFSSVGFLDDLWWHRTYWLLGATMGSNYGGWPQVGNRVPAGRLLVLDEDHVYGFGRNQYIRHGAHVGIDGASIFHFNPSRDAQRRDTYYQAFAIDRQGPPSGKPKAQAKGARRRPGVPAKEYRWTQKLPILARAMVLAGDTLFLAGPPDLFATGDPVGALEGKRGGALLGVSTSDGSRLAEYDLDAPPVFDGLIAAAGRLYLATTDGKIVCMGQAE